MDNTNREIFVFVAKDDAEYKKYLIDTHLESSSFKVFLLNHDVAKKTEITKKLGDLITEDDILSFLQDILNKTNIQPKNCKRLFVCTHFGGGDKEAIPKAKERINDVIKKYHPKIQFLVLSEANNIPATFWAQSKNAITIPNNLDELKNKLGLSGEGSSSAEIINHEPRSNSKDTKDLRAIALLNSLSLLCQAVSLLENDEQGKKRETNNPIIRNWWLCDEDIKILDGYCCSTTSKTKTLYYYLSTGEKLPQGFDFSESAADLKSICQNVSKIGG